MNRILTPLVLIAAIAAVASAQGMKGGKKGPPLSPVAQASATIDGKAITIKYSAPSLRGRMNIFEPGGRISKDPTYPVWRAGANAATALHPGGTLEMKGLTVPPGDYTLYVFLDQGKWELIVNKQTGQWGTVYNKAEDLGRVPMTMSKPSAPVETYKISLTPEGRNHGKLTLAWAEVVASVPFTVK